MDHKKDTGQQLQTATYSQICNAINGYVWEQLERIGSCAIIISFSGNFNFKVCMKA
jgi:hypothetical protein